MRYLSMSDISLALGRGKPVEQFLARSPDNSHCVRYLELRPAHGSVELWAYDVEDVGSEDWLDLYDFPYLDPDGPDAPAGIFQDAKAAIAFAGSAFFAGADRWTDQFISQDEYLDFIHAGRPHRWPLAP